MKNKCIFLIILWLTPVMSHGQEDNFYRNPIIEQSIEYKLGNSYQKDFLLLMDMLNNCHPAFVLNDKNIHEIVDTHKAYKNLDRCESFHQFRIFSQSILSRINDGHTALLYQPSETLLYPIYYERIGDEIVITGIQKEFGSVLNKSILSINGESFQTLYDSFKSLVSTDNDISFKAKINSILPYFSNWEDCKKASPDSSLTIKFTDGDQVKVKPCSKSQLNILRSSTNTDKRTNYFSYTIIDSLSLCIFNFDTCEDQTTLYNYYKSKNLLTDQLESRIKAIPVFDSVVEKMFSELHQKQIEYLVIDVRNNSGGNSVLCDVLLSWMSTNIKQYKTIAIESSLYTKNYPNADYGTLENAHGYHFNTDPSLCYNGKIIVFQGEKTYSSAGMFVTSVKDNNLGIIVGNESAFLPTGYGDILSWTLPNTHLSGSISYKKFIRPSGDNTDNCLIPDYLITQNREDSSIDDCYFRWLREFISDTGME